jgi:hypothetical protein
MYAAGNLLHGCRVFYNLICVLHFICCYWFDENKVIVPWQFEVHMYSHFLVVAYG